MIRLGNIYQLLLFLFIYLVSVISPVSVSVISPVTGPTGLHAIWIDTINTMKHNHSTKLSFKSLAWERHNTWYESIDVCNVSSIEEAANLTEQLY